MTNHKGFTLIELLSVIAVIAILLSIMMPALRSARERSKQSTCLAHLQQIGYGEFMYAMENNDYFPDRDTLGGFPFRAAPGYINPDDPFRKKEIYGIAAVLEKYVNYDSNSSLWVCTGQPEKAMRELGNTYWAWSGPNGTSFASAKKASKTALAGDNYAFKRYTPGVRAKGIEPGFTLEEDERMEPHTFGISGKKGASTLYADCHAGPIEEQNSDTDMSFEEIFDDLFAN